MYKRVCMVCGNDNSNLVILDFDKEICMSCGESIFEFVEVTDTTQVASNTELLKYKLIRDSQNIF